MSSKDTITAPRAVLANCVADDWGLSPGVNEGILELCRKGVVRHVSLLANTPHVGSGLEELLRVPGLRFGLHLNFTYGRPLSPRAETRTLCSRSGCFRGLRGFALRWMAGLVRRDELRAEAQRQIEALRRRSVPVSSVEGHHHVHLLPGIDAALGSVFEQNGLRRLRVPSDPAHAPSYLLGRWFALRARDRALEPERTLYLRPEDLLSRERLRRKLANRGGLPVLVHPAKHDDIGSLEFPDPCRGERVAQYRALRDWIDEPA